MLAKNDVNDICVITFEVDLTEGIVGLHAFVPILLTVYLSGLSPSFCMGIVTNFASHLNRMYQKNFMPKLHGLPLSDSV